MIRPKNRLLESLGFFDRKGFAEFYGEALTRLSLPPPTSIPDNSQAASMRLEAGAGWHDFEQSVVIELLNSMRSIVTPELLPTVSLLAGAFEMNWIYPMARRLLFKKPDGKVSLVEGRLQLPEGKVYLDRDFLVCCPELIVHRLIGFGVAAGRLEEVKPWGGGAHYWKDPEPSKTQAVVSMALRVFSQCWGTKLLQIGFESVDIGGALPDFLRSRD